LHGYAVGVLARALGRRLAAWFGSAPISVIAATGWTGGALMLTRAPRRAVLVRRGRGSAALTVLGLVAGGLIAPGASAVAPVPGILGGEGLRFVAGGPRAAEIAAVAGGPAIDPLRVYVGMSSAGTIAERVRLAVAELERVGGFTRSAVLVVVPTGSGWVNPAAVLALEHLMRGDLATVVVQYAARPSWQEYLRGGAAAEHSATALVGALRARLVAAGPHRPRLLVYGESLGALGAIPAVTDADAALLAGLPAAAWDPAAGPPVRTVLHPDDPVVWWSPRLLVQRPAGWPGPWFPVVTFWQVTGSLLGAVDAPPGHGHHYGGELADAWRAAGFDTAASRSAL
ncbi:MAG: alpha/beta-hydrolase family protein, partial [Actinomycetes bacterium]